MDDIGNADLVVSLAGRDRGQLFFVVKEEPGYVWIADGKGRKLEKPKRKKCKHVKVIPLSDSRVADKIRCGDKTLNSELRRELTILGQKFNSQNQGVI